MPASTATDQALAVFSASRSQEAWEGLEAAELVIEVHALVGELQGALAGTGIKVRDALPDYGVLVLTGPALRGGKAVTVGFILARAEYHGIEQFDAYRQLIRELRAAIERLEQISEVADLVGFLGVQRQSQAHHSQRQNNPPVTSTGGLFCCPRLGG